MSSSRVRSAHKPLSIYSQQVSQSELKTRQEAKQQQSVIHAQLNRANKPIPPYEFQNYIGKGSYGRVYVAQDTRQDGYGRVAIKILDVDSVDFKASLADRDFSFEGFLQELHTLRQLESYAARNVNLIYDVLEVHSQLWIISEYCPGGSVHTLMQATNNKVAEEYIIPIARELAVGLDAVHKAKVMHRDVKAANVMIHEEGRLQIIDFGVAGMLVSEDDKRKTMIGTPHWMGPEVLSESTKGYGKEVDTWAFGCTLIEMATGAPPRRNLTVPSQLEKANRMQPPPKLRVEQGYSKGLCELVAFTLKKDPSERPSMQQILEHPYLKGTEYQYPTESLAEFVKHFQHWMNAGGQRQSLVNPYGAEAAKLADGIISKPEWRFSTLESTEFLEGLDSDADEHLALELSGRDPPATRLDQIADLTSTHAQEDAFDLYNASQPSSPYLSTAEDTPNGSPRSSAASHVDSEEDWRPSTRAKSQKETDESKVARGEKQLGRLFDQRKSEYTFPGLNTKQSDLPLRNQVSDSPDTNVKGNQVDANNIGTSNSGSLQLMDASTLKAKKAKDRPPTMDWTFPMAAPSDTIVEPLPPPPLADKSPDVTHQNMAAWTPDFIEDYGAPSDDAEEDRYSAASTPSYPSQQPQPPMAMEMEMDMDLGNSRQARQTLDLDALLEDPGSITASHQSFEDPSLHEPPPVPVSTVDTASPDFGATIKDFGSLNTGPYSSDYITSPETPLTSYPLDEYHNMIPPMQQPPATSMAHEAPPEAMLADMERTILEWGAMMMPLAEKFSEIGDLKDGEVESEGESTVVGVGIS